MSGKYIYKARKLLPVIVVIGLAASVRTAQAAAVMDPPNRRPVAVLGMLDIDGDGFADAAPDSDGDGLPDNMEVGGFEPFVGVDRFVSFPAPIAVRSSQIPSFLLSRTPVTTRADTWDTDGDGLSDFVEVFGLKFIDDNHNGRLDFEPGIDFRDSNGNGQWDPGEIIYASAEWIDLNMDGLPSIGEWPFPNLFGAAPDGLVDDYGNSYVYVIDDCNGDTIPDTPRVMWNVPVADRLLGACSTAEALLAQYAAKGIVDVDGDLIPDRIVIAGVSHDLVKRDSDFDGFVFTDPTKWDTDGDGVSDGDDPDPLVNAQIVAPSFGSGFERALSPSPGDQDLDNDGLGDGSDFGNDLTTVVDFPSDIAARIAKAAPPDRQTGCITPTLPESLIEDLLGEDWNGDGLWRLTDVSHYRVGIPVPSSGPDCLQQIYGSDFESLFVVNGHSLYARNPILPSGVTACQTPQDLPPKACVNPSHYNQRGIGMGWQEKLLQAAQAKTTFFPDVRLWAILYAWRVPGFDIDGNGNIGVYENTFSADEVHAYYIPPPPACGLCGSGLLGVLATCAGFMALKFVRPGRRG